MANEVRLIDVAPLIADGWVLEKHGVSNCIIGRKSLADVPTIDLESLRPKGRFKIEYHDEFDMLKRICSICGYVKWTDIHTSLDWNYCPNCGAKMMED